MSGRAVFPSRRASLLMLALLALAILPYGIARIGIDAGAELTTKMPLLAGFTAVMVALLVVSYVLSARRRIIL